MARCPARPRASWKRLPCAALALLLAACGGGGGGTGGDAGNGGAGGATTESAYLLAEFVAKDSNDQVVHVWDPARPGTPVQDVRIVQSDGIAWTSSHLVFSDATRFDAATGTLTTLGHARVFFDNDGKLYTIDLRGGQPHAPVQLSSATDVFEPVRAVAISADGADAWVDAQGGTHDWAIRSTMTAASAPVSVLHLEGALRDAATGLPQYLFVSLGGQSGTAVQPTTFEVVDPGFAVQPVPAVAGMVTYDDWLGADPAVPGLAYLRIAGRLRALRWSSTGVAVDTADLHDFTPALLPAAAVADASALYVADGQSLLAVSDGQVRAVGSFSRAPDVLTDAGGFVAATEVVSSSSTVVEALRKTGGALSTLASGTAGLAVAAG
ncbi:MAG TPA: hypothetical protein VF457_02235, partial [Burkholderiaceae bacterium]